MSSLANRVFEFAQHVIETAGGEISSALALPHQYSNPGGESEKRFVRVWDAVGGRPVRNDISSKVVRYNPQIAVEFFTSPDDLSVDEQVTAREITSAMADQFTAAMDETGNENLRATDGTICDVQIIRQDDDWRAFGEKLYPVTYLILQFNTR